MATKGFEKLRVYKLAEDLSDLVWSIVSKRGTFERDTIGKQLVRSTDSIGANIAEGTGRGSFADNRRFAKIARASMFEVKHWLRRAYKRDLLSDSEIQRTKKILDELAPKLSAYINSIGNIPMPDIEKAKKVPIVTIDKQIKRPATNDQGQMTRDK